MKSRIAKTEGEKSIPEMADDVTREEMRQMYKDGKLTAYGRRMSKFLERVLPDEKVDERGWSLSRKERAKIKRLDACECLRTLLQRPATQARLCLGRYLRVRCWRISPPKRSFCGASLEYAVVHSDEEEAERIREELRRLTG